MFQQRAYPWIRRIEGGWLNHPKDPGRATFAGVSERAVVGVDQDGDGRFDFDLDHDGDVDTRDMEILRDRAEAGDRDALSLIESFYRVRYWNVVKADELGWPFNLLTFDAAVHHGSRPAVLLLQRGLGLTADGIIGPATIAAARKASDDKAARMLAHRVDLFRSICAKRGDDFWPGWCWRATRLAMETKAW